MRYPALPVLSATAAVLVLVPLPSQLRKRNVATLTLLISTFFLHATLTINTLVWAGNVRDSAPVWCDISSTILFLWAYAALGATLCIARHLEWIISARGGALERPHRMLFEIVLCCVPAMLSIPIRYILSISRYAIVEDVGCVFYLHTSTVWVVLRSVPEFTLAFASFAYSCVAVGNLIRRRISAQHGNSPLTFTTSRFVRLLSVCFILGAWPLVVVFVLFFVPPPPKKLPAWPGWTAVHKHFHLIPRLPAAFRPPALWQSLIQALWVHLVTALLTFGIFVFTEDVREDLKRVWVFVTSRMAVSGKISCLRRNRRNETPPSQWFDADDGVHRNPLAMLVAHMPGLTKVRTTSPTASDVVPSLTEAGDDEKVV